MRELAGHVLLDTIHESSRTIVYRGRRARDGAPVIVKTIRSERPSPEELRRFRQEYDLLRMVSPESEIVGYGGGARASRLAIVMADWGAESLASYLRARGRLEIDEFLDVAIRIVGALGDVHRRNIIHKDINPSNIVIHAGTGQVRIIDFGIATALPRESLAVKNANVLEGTLRYISPEQTGRMNRALDYRTDFYSLGVTFYEMLTGAVPFSSSDALELVHLHIAKEPAPPAALRPDLPEALSDIVLVLLAKTSEERYRSAYGLKADLAFCREARRAGGSISGFVQGRSDVSEKFQIPQKLYGREAEIAAILATFDRVGEGRSELLLVSGYSGVGKSVLVSEIQKNISRRRGYFISGKFDQLRRDVPYASLLQAFGALVRQLLGENEARLAEWRAKILAAVGANGRVLSEVLPDLELVLGAQPPVQPLLPAESQNRFDFTFQSFVGAIVAKEHPLAIFLDDLQWADAPSLHMLELLARDPESKHLLVIGAYRDNEVSAAHPLRIAIEAIEKSGASVTTLEVKPLDLEHVTALACDTLRCDRARGEPLARLALEKTGGNPFFLGQFLKSLYDEGLFDFDPERGEWSWALDDICRRGITDNVVELMAAKMKRLPEETRRALLWAACVGNRFDLETLAIVGELSLARAGADLWRALEEGLIVPEDEAYRALQPTSGEWDAEVGTNAAFTFLHDRVQQAAYSLIAEEDRSALHLKLGRLLLEKTPPEERDERIFDIVNHLDVGMDRITQKEERLEVARLNLAAGRKAKKSAAYEPARHYLATGLRLLSDEDWKEIHDLAFELHVESMEAEYLCGDFARSSRLSEISLEHAKTPLERVRVFEVRMLFHTAQNDGYKTITTAFEALAALGIELPAPDAIGPADIGAALQSAGALIAGRRIADLCDLPVMTDVAALAAVRVLTVASAPAFNKAPQALPLITSELVRLSLRHGNAPLSSFGYTLYALLQATALDDLVVANELADLALALSSRFHDKVNDARMLASLAFFIKHRTMHVREVAEFARVGIGDALSVGDIDYVGFNSNTYVKDLFLTGSALDFVHKECARYLALLARFKHEFTAAYLHVFRQAVLNLMGESLDPKSLLGEAIDAGGGARVIIGGAASSSSVYFVLQAMLRYLFGDMAGSVAAARETRGLLHGLQGIDMRMWHHAFECLALLALYEGADEEEKRRTLEVVREGIGHLAAWAKDGPMNYLHLQKLVEAERARILGEKLEAMELYEQAIQIAAEHQYLPVEALAWELAAGFYQSLGRAHIAESHLVEARYRYLRWGAKAKVAELDQRFPWLSARAESRGSVADRETISITQSSRGITLDWQSVTKAARAISGEIVLERLLGSLMRAVVENAGAERGVLLFSREEGLFIEAEWSIAGGGKAKARTAALLEEEEASVCAAIVKYVARTRQSVILADASTDGAFEADPYILARRPRSVLCSPLINQDKLIAIVFLENNLTAGAFTADRLEVLGLLLAQAALSLHNASLYRSLEDHSRTLEQKVDERTRELSAKNTELADAITQLRATQRQLVTQEKLASLGSLTAGIAHELRNPLNLANNFAEFSADLTTELEETLATQKERIEPQVMASLGDVLGSLRSAVTTINQHGRRANAIITAMLQHARASTGTREAADLNQLVAESVHIACEVMRKKDSGTPTEVRVAYDAAIGEVYVVRDDLRRALINIIENAMHAVRQKRDGARGGYVPEIRIGTRALGDSVEVSIRDNGPGIVSDVAEKIYNPFFTTKPAGQGTGLGLSICRDIVVDGHGGEVTMATSPGEFTEFVVKLSRKRATAANTL